MLLVGWCLVSLGCRWGVEFFKHVRPRGEEIRWRKGLDELKIPKIEKVVA